MQAVLAAQDIRQMPLNEIHALNNAMYFQVEDDMKKNVASHTSVSHTDGSYGIFPANGWGDDGIQKTPYILPQDGISPFHPYKVVPTPYIAPHTTGPWVSPPPVEEKETTIDILKELLEQQKQKPSDLTIEALLVELEVRINKMPQGTNEEIQARIIAKQSLEMIRAMLIQ